MEAFGQLERRSSSASRAWWTLTACLMLCTVAAGCGSDDESGPADSAVGDAVDVADAAAGDADADDAGTLLVTPVTIDEATIGAEGGTLRASDNAVTVNLPAGALATPTALRLVQLLPQASKDDRVPDDPWLVPTRRYRLEPLGLTLAVPAWVSIQVPASEMPYPSTLHDLGLYRSTPTGWVQLALDPPPGVLKYYPSELHRGGTMDVTAEFAARLIPPYDAAPELVQIGAQTAVSTPEGPILAIESQGVISIWGRGFGWDATGVEVQVGDAVVPANSGIRNALLTFNLALPAPTLAIELPVVVRVKGRASNALLLRIRGASSGKSTLSNVQPSGGTCMGCKVRLSGTFYGDVSSRRVVIGGVEQPAEVDEGGQLWVQVPTTLTPGTTDIRVIDGLGGEPSDAWPYVVWRKIEPTLTAGQDAGGVWLPPNQQGIGEPTLMLEVADLPPSFSPLSQVEVRFAAAGVTGAWTTIPYIKKGADACAGLPEGSCALALPTAISQGLQAGDSFTVQVRHHQHVMPEGVPPDASQVELVLESAPLTLQVAGRGLPGGTAYAYVGEAGGAWQDAPCGLHAGQPFNVHDLLCLKSASPCAASCADLQTVQIPGLLAPTVFSATGSGSDPRGARLRCVPLVQAGSYTLSNAGQASSCTIDVLSAGGQVWTAPIDVGDGSADIALAAGGGRLALPAGTLPTLPTGQSYTVEFRGPVADDPTNPPPKLVDPAAVSKLGVWSLKISPEPASLKKAGTLALPVDPTAGSAPGLGLIDTTTSFVHKLQATYDEASGRLVATLAAGGYAAPTGKPQPGVPAPVVPAPFNSAFAAIGVTYQTVEPGVLQDAGGRFRVDYVVDPTSPHHVSEAYAVSVLGAATTAWDVLAGLGWKLPTGPIALSIRATVSVFSSTAKGATTPGYVGQPWMTIQVGLGAKDLANVVAHEVGHLFQRQYTTNLTLSWLDEAMAEWTAWKTVGEAGYDTDALTGDQDAARVVMAGLPDSFGGVNAAYVYGTAAWSIWLGWSKGDATLRQAYEALDWSPPHWISSYATLQDASGKTIETLARAFAEDFWMQTYAPVSAISLGASLQAIPTLEQLPFDSATGGSWTLPARPALSSQRYRIPLPASEAALVNVGDIVVRASGVGPGAEISLWSSVLALDPSKATLIERVSADKPVKVLPMLPTGSIWVLHNHFSTAGGGAVTLGFELPRITSLSSDSAKAGQDVVVNGNHFGGKTGTLLVGGTAVAPTWTGWTNTKLSFTMPSFANTAKVTVRVKTAEDARTNEVYLTVVQ